MSQTGRELKRIPTRAKHTGQKVDRVAAQSVAHPSRPARAVVRGASMGYVGGMIGSLWGKPGAVAGMALGASSGAKSSWEHTAHMNKGIGHSTPKGSGVGRQQTARGAAHSVRK